jgi:hypothetical protein
MEKEAKLVEECYKQDYIDPKIKLLNHKENLKESLGEENYEKVYQMLWKYRSNPDASDLELYDEVKKTVGNNKVMLTLAFQLDAVVFREVLANMKN